MKSTVVWLSGSQPEAKTTRIHVHTPAPNRDYIHSADDARSFRMGGAIKALDAFMRRYQADINAGRLAELTETLRQMREDEAALSRRRREAFGS